MFFYKSVLKVDYYKQSSYIVRLNKGIRINWEKQLCRE